MSISIAAKLSGRVRRKVRVRKKISGSQERPRLSVFRSARHVFAQVIDDVAGNTVVSVGTHGGSATGSKDDNKVDQARAVGKRLAELCREKNITAVVFDRNGFRYHGRVRAVAEAAREGGLTF